MNKSNFSVSFSTFTPVNGTNYTITIGAGGAAGTNSIINSSVTNGEIGSSSSIVSIVTARYGDGGSKGSGTITNTQGHGWVYNGTNGTGANSGSGNTGSGTIGGGYTTPTGSGYSLNNISYGEGGNYSGNNLTNTGSGGGSGNAGSAGIVIIYF